MAPQWVLSLGAQLFGLGQLGNVAANIGTQLITLRFSREDEIESDLVGLEMGARAGYNPNASVSLWEKMGKEGGDIFLADSAGNRAVNPATGFITPASNSFWTATVPATGGSRRIVPGRSITSSRAFQPAPGGKR